MLGAVRAETPPPDLLREADRVGADAESSPRSIESPRGNAVRTRCLFAVGRAHVASGQKFAKECLGNTATVGAIDGAEYLIAQGMSRRRMWWPIIGSAKSAMWTSARARCVPKPMSVPGAGEVRNSASTLDVRAERDGAVAGKETTTPHTCGAGIVIATAAHRAGASRSEHLVGMDDRHHGESGSDAR